MSRSSLIAAFGVFLASTSPLLAVCARAEEPILSKADDPAINAASQEARKTLPIFWAKFDAHAPAYQGFALKVAFPSDHGGREHIWVDQIVRDGDKVSGHLANDPFDLKRLHMGSKVTFGFDQISDWQYVKEQKLYGHYTTRAMMDRASPDQRAQASSMFAPTPLEAGKP